MEKVTLILPYQVSTQSARGFGGRDALLISVGSGKVNLLLARLVFDLILAVFDVLLAVVVVAVVCLLLLLKSNFRVQLGGELLRGGIWDGKMSNERTQRRCKTAYLDSETERWKNEQRI